MQLFSGPKLSSRLTFGPPRAKSLKYEYGELACTIELVSDVDSAINHIHTYGSGHTEVIISENRKFYYKDAEYCYLRDTKIPSWVLFFSKIRENSFEVSKRR